MNTRQFEEGKVSIIMVTYNRGHLIRNSIESLLNQTYKNLEIIIVDNGCTDDTSLILQEYNRPEYAGTIRLFRLEENRRFAGGANYGLAQIRGEWFTLLDDDDFAYPHAMETMLDIPKKIDPNIDAITCNCIDSSTGQFSGKGPHKDQYLSFEDVVKHGDGEFWGITKSELIQDAKFNENLLGYESTFWYQISQRANRYYIHQALRVWTTDQGPTISKFVSSKNRKAKAQNYRVLAGEDIYWDALAAYLPGRFRSKCLKGLLYLYMDDDIEGARKYLKKLGNQSNLSAWIGQISMMIPRRLLRRIFHYIPL
jgi:glycosyltransferase involved in cell wall biosynthesis